MGFYCTGLISLNTYLLQLVKILVHALLIYLAENTVCPNVTKYGSECPLDVDNECLSDQECSAGRKCCPTPYDNEACQLLCLVPVPQSKRHL